MMKKTAAIMMTLMLCMTACCAQAFTLTGREVEQVERNWATNKFFARMEALTGIAVEAKGVADAEDYDALLSGMLKGNITTDALFKADLTRAQEKALLDSGAIIDLAPLIDAHMPNLSALLAAHPEWREMMTLEDGRIASLPQITEKERQAALWINKSWLDKLGMAMPQTLEELTAALIALRDSDSNGNGRADEVGADLIGVYEMRWLLPYFGIVADDYHLARGESGEIVFAPALPAYREFIALLRQWNDQGVLPEDAFTRVHSTALLSESSEEKPIVSGMLMSVTPYTHVEVSAVTQYEPVLIAGPDGKVRWRDMLGCVWPGCFAVTSRCEDPAQALKWVDALYVQEGALLGYAGVEGEDYTYTSEGYWAFDVQDNSDISRIRSEVLMYTGIMMPGLYPADFVNQVDSALDRHIFEASERVRAVSERVTQPYCLNDADQEKADALAVKIGKLVDEGIARFATGEMELSDANYDAWLSSLRAAGSEELVALFADAK